VTAGLVWELVARDLRLRYRRSTLGLLWSQATPLVYAAVLTLVFTRVVPLDIDDYPVFVLLGLLPWLWASAALTSGTTAVVDAPDLLRHPRFPREALPAAAVGATLVHHLLALPVVLALAVAAAGWPGVAAAPRRRRGLRRTRRRR
jgi:lipopolysaccharide transport system permease protein